MIEFSDLTVGLAVIVSTSEVEPVDQSSAAWRAWRSRNFTGTVTALTSLSADIETQIGETSVTFSVPNNGSHTFEPVTPTDDQLNTFYWAIVDAAAGEFRTRFITSVPGQEGTYQLKLDEATAWTSGSDPANFPFLSAESAVRGISMDDMATMVLTIAGQWKAMAVKIEAKRIGAKDAVTAATTRDAKAAAANVDWESLLT